MKPKKPKTESTPEVSHSRKRNNQQQQQQLEETSVTYIETVETSGEEIISMEGLEGSTVILENGTVRLFSLIYKSTFLFLFFRFYNRI